MFTPSQSYHYIEEYTALWTAQKHQKAKRWQDGHLRLHTFNSRLFLTDSTGTAVSDKYYLSSRTPIYIENDKAGQSRGSLECDTEIEFEQHLVQVLDFLGWRKGEANVCPVEEARKRKREEIAGRAIGEKRARDGRSQTPMSSAWQTQGMARKTPSLASRSALAPFTPVRPTNMNARVYPTSRQPLHSAHNHMPESVETSRQKKRDAEEAFHIEAPRVGNSAQRPNTELYSSSPAAPSTFEGMARVRNPPGHSSKPAQSVNRQQAPVSVTKDPSTRPNPAALLIQPHRKPIFAAPPIRRELIPPEHPIQERNYPQQQNHPPPSLPPPPPSPPLAPPSLLQQQQRNQHGQRQKQKTQPVRKPQPTKPTVINIPNTPSPPLKPLSPSYFSSQEHIPNSPPAAQVSKPSPPRKPSSLQSPPPQIPTHHCPSPEYRPHRSPPPRPQAAAPPPPQEQEKVKLMLAPAVIGARRGLRCLSGPSRTASTSSTTTGGMVVHNVERPDSAAGPTGSHKEGISNGRNVSRVSPPVHVKENPTTEIRPGKPANVSKTAKAPAPRKSKTLKDSTAAENAEAAVPAVQKKKTQPAKIRTKISEPVPEPVPPPKVVDTDMGAWSSEAFDLFDWRPPPESGIVPPGR